jgi:hypothetical protein
MKFECGDLERALAVSELMPEAREHLKDCPACRREYRIWNDLSAAAKGLREEWDSPLLWPAIRRGLEAQREQMRAAKGKENSLARWAVWNKRWMLSGAIAAALLLGAGLLLWTQLSRPAIKPPLATQTAALSGNRDFLTEQALAEVEKNEAAYRQSIGKLSALAEPRLRQAASPVAVSYREKLLMLDSAISDTRSNLDHNRFNVRLRMDLADLYREKQQTLKELLTGDHKN